MNATPKTNSKRLMVKLHHGLFFYAAAVTIATTVSSIFSNTTITLILLPLTGYFTYKLASKTSAKKIPHKFQSHHLVEGYTPQPKQVFLSVLTLIVLSIFGATNILSVKNQPPPPQPQTTPSPSPRSTPALTPSPAQKPQVFINTDPQTTIDIKQLPSTDSKTINQVPGSTNLPLITQTKDWLEVLLQDGSTGWVSKDQTLIK